MEKLGQEKADSHFMSSFMVAFSDYFFKFFMIGGKQETLSWFGEVNTHKRKDARRCLDDSACTLKFFQEAETLPPLTLRSSLCRAEYIIRCCTLILYCWPYCWNQISQHVTTHSRSHLTFQPSLLRWMVSAFHHCIQVTWKLFSNLLFVK